MKNTHPNVHVNLFRGESATVAHLRAALKRRSVKLTVLAKQLGIPYRSLQNYFQRNEMPLSMYERICEATAINKAYPMSGSRMKLEHSALQEALVQVFGQSLPLAIIEEIEGGINIKRVPSSGNERDAVDLQRQAGLFANLIEGAYDQILERELAEPIDEGAD